MVVEYVKDTYNYSIEYYYNGVKDDSKTETGLTAEFGETITTYPDKNIDGYKLNNTPSVTITSGTNVMVVQYVKDSSATIELNVRKFWYDSETPSQIPQLTAFSSMRPENITVHLLDKEGIKVDSTTISLDENWFGTFIVPMYGPDNEEINYSEHTIEEELPDNYIYKFENYGNDGFELYNIEVMNVPVTKEWYGSVGDEVTIVLLDSEGEPTDYTLTLNENNDWTDSFKLPKFEVGEAWWDFTEIDYSDYNIDEVSVVGYSVEISGNVNEGGFVVTNTADTVNYTVNYLELGTDLPVADSVTKSGIYGTEVTEYAIDVEEYNKVGQTEKVITLGLNENSITFYYSKQGVIDESDFYEINWMYETGYNTNTYNKRYGEDGEGSVTESDIANYVQLHYDSGYTYVRRVINQDTVEVIEVIDVTSGSAITGSAVTGTGVKLVTTTIVNLYYDRNRPSRPGRPNPPVIIEDSEIPLADLEKDDHFAYVIGYPDGEVKPMGMITREEVAMIFYRLLTDESRNEWLSDANSFTDITADRWSNRAISTLYNAGIIKGYPDGTFRPSDPISRAEFATIAAKFDMLELQDTTKFTDIFDHWAEKYITSSEIKGWIKGYPDFTFKPEQDITRAEAMTLINNVLERAVPEENIHPDAMFWPDMTSDDWYYEAVMEATNSHDYIYEEDGDELWTGMKANKVWP